MLQIAKVLKSNGTEGGLLLGFRDIDPEDLDIKEPVFIEYDGLPVPFFVLSLERRGNTKAIVKLSDIDSYEDAEEIVGRAVYAEDFEQEEGEGGLEALIGWTLVNAGDGTVVGEITDFADYSANPCLEVDYRGSSVLVPIHEDLVGGVDPEGHTVSLHIPDGLLEL